MESNDLQQVFTEAVLKKTTDDDYLKTQVSGYNWNHGVDYNKLLENFKHVGFQATNFGLAVDEINKMITCRNLPLSKEVHSAFDDPFVKIENNCTIFLGYTSNIVSSGLRETIKFLVQHKLVDCLVTTAGGIEEDFIKCLAPTYVGSFNLDGKTLRDKGINRIGNLLAPNDNYCKFEDWIMPIFDEMLVEQKENNVLWSPSKIITRLGEKINNADSIYYWAAKNHIPVFSPALTDGSLGDMIFFHSFKNPGLIIDIASVLEQLRPS